MKLLQMRELTRTVQLTNKRNLSISFGTKEKKHPNILDLSTGNVILYNERERNRQDGKTGHAAC